MIPQEETDPVTRGVREAFGVTEFEDFTRITGWIPRILSDLRA